MFLKRVDVKLSLAFHFKLDLHVGFENVSSIIFMLSVKKNP